MKPYLLSAAAGLLVGVIYALLNVRSPAPPVIALVGLLGILAGEQIPPLVRHLMSRPPGVSWLQQQVRPHMFGALPGCDPSEPTPPVTLARQETPDD
ncbi:XapX domain-containing protein [Ideonella oryzae]|uniref:XapX domain-containing protein n=1 Tax=Ideonella oryzae TaxID=2937441 RepID=A0ABT1BSC2_9BURK|nr:XapX domain-containing protein [Ideonella oryzae]MCO5978297.1 XapX domain-containing protein [Ideonella oryzae]